MIRRPAHRRVLAAAVAAHPGWPPEHDAIRAAYRVSTTTSAFDEPLAIEAYQSVVDREERTADTYASLTSRVRCPAETGSAHQTWLTKALARTWERQ